MYITFTQTANRVNLSKLFTKLCHSVCFLSLPNSNSRNRIWRSS